MPTVTEESLKRSALMRDTEMLRFSKCVVESLTSIQQNETELKLNILDISIHSI